MKSCKENWKCIRNCGACCRLAPLERLEALESLTPSQEMKYLMMVGEDGWCIHYDRGSQSCKIYQDRPDFCKVSNLKQFFDLGAKGADASASSYCRQHIRAVYGGKSKVMRKFQREVSKPIKTNEQS